MRKLFKLVFVIGTMAITSCGPSAQEKQAEEQRELDSIKAADAAMKAAEEAAAAEAMAVAVSSDTTHAADSTNKQVNQENK